jgi:hypothetical protein
MNTILPAIGLGFAAGLSAFRPLRTLYRQAKYLATPEAANARRLSSLRNRHCGRRGVVIGNGPSLNVKDLDRLQGEITFASNKIFLAFDQVAWRPTYYSCSDILVAKNNREAMNRLDLVKVYGESVKAEFADRSDITWLRERNGPLQQFSTDCSECVYGGFSVVYYQLQLAFHLGIREVILIGMDFSFDVPKPSGEVCEHGAVIMSQGEVNHFHKDYRKPGETWTMPRLDKQLEAFECARVAFGRAGGRVLNASRSTRLTVFPRINFDDVFPPLSRYTSRLSPACTRFGTARSSSIK